MNWQQLQNMLNQLRGYLLCDCGEILQTRERVVDHWRKGHFEPKNTTKLTR